MALILALTASPALAATPASPKAKAKVTATATASTTQQKNTKTVYITKRGKYYHKLKCIKLMFHATKSIKVYEAEQKELQPCHHCFKKK